MEHMGEHLGGGMTEGHMMGQQMMGEGMSGLGWLAMSLVLLVIAAVVIAIVVAVGVLLRGVTCFQRRRSPDDRATFTSAGEELDVRYARGELTRDDYWQARNDLNV